VIRLVLDTNVVLDCLVFRDPASCELIAALESKRVVPLSHALTVEELRRVLAYPQCRLDDGAQREVLNRYSELTTPIATPDGFSRKNLSVPADFPRCRDRDDDLFLALAFHGRADALISKDHDLLKLRRKAKRFGVQIVSVAEWKGMNGG
jgi:putative PIN family toxin of toxin-antitoxin system